MAANEVADVSGDRRSPLLGELLEVLHLPRPQADQDLAILAFLVGQPGPASLAAVGGLGHNKPYQINGGRHLNHDKASSVRRRVDL